MIALARDAALALVAAAALALTGVGMAVGRGLTRSMHMAAGGAGGPQ